MRQIASVLGLCVLGSLATAAENPAVAQIHEKIKELEAGVKLLHKDKEVHMNRVLGWYKSIIKRDALTEDILIVERKELRLQEDELLAVAQTDEARKAIHERYDGIRALLRVDTKLDQVVIDKLVALKDAHKLQIELNYDAKIEAVKAEIEVLKLKAKTLSETKPKK